MNNVEYLQQKLQAAANAVELARQNLSQAESAYEVVLKAAPAAVVRAVDTRRFSQGERIVTDC